MKQKLFFIITGLCVISFFSCRKNDTPVQTKTLLIKAAYQSYTDEYNYESGGTLINTFRRFSSSPGDLGIISITKYDNKGRVEESIFTFPSGSVVRSVNIYNANGKKEQEDQYTRTNNGEVLSWQYFYTYTGNTVLVRRKNISNGTTLNYYELTYDNTGNIAVYKIYNSSSGSLIQQQEYSDFDGKKEANSLLPEGFSEIVFKENYRSVKITSYNANGSVNSVNNFTYTYEYDADGYPTKRTTIGGNSPSIITYSYKKVPL